VNDFIPKPILSEELLLRINNLITNKRLLDKIHDQRRELYTLATTNLLDAITATALWSFQESF
jgi:two-component system, cell cycle response regulator